MRKHYITYIGLPLPAKINSKAIALSVPMMERPGAFFIPLFFGWFLCRQETITGDTPALKIPTLDELKQLKKEACRRFRQAIKKSSATGPRVTELEGS